jgi:hypothetical protein
MRYVSLLAFVYCGAVLAADKFPQAPEKQVTVPYVGCKSDGQTGRLPPPKAAAKKVNLPAPVAQRLAYYKAEGGPGILAPSGWYCYSVYGSNGETLFVSPDPIPEDKIFSDWKGFEGPAIQLTLLYAETRGRFEVAMTIARVFPAYKKFAMDVIAEGILPASMFPFGPYPADKLKYLGDRMVEFETPADSEGLGTKSRLAKTNKPITGVAILEGDELDLLQLSMRLTPQTNDLGRIIVRQLEHEATRSRK